MDEVLTDLGELLIKALPTFIILILLHFYLKWAFYGPLDRLLRRRWEATEGARTAAAESLESAQRKAETYEEAVREARTEIYKEQEQMRRKWQQGQAAALAQARGKMGVVVKEANAGLAAEAEAARQNLEAESEALAEQITHRLLERRAS